MQHGTLAYITPVTGEHPDQGLPPGVPGTPSHPIELPPLPPGFEVSHPIAPPSGGTPSHPIIIPGTPEHPIAAPPGTVWPPLDPSAGLPPGKSLVLIAVIGANHSMTRWLVVDVIGEPSHPWVPPIGGGKPPVAQPK